MVLRGSMQRNTSWRTEWLRQSSMHRWKGGGGRGGKEEGRGGDRGVEKGEGEGGGEGWGKKGVHYRVYCIVLVSLFVHVVHV